ncbi:MAG: GSCFA domain-containing protein [Bacteroidales bacterium]
MKFRTELHIKKTTGGAGYKKPIMMLGSCFTDNIGQYLKKYLFTIAINPFGVIYNPMSIRNGIQTLLFKEKYLPEDLQFYNELYFSFDHYTKFSDPDKNSALQKINSTFLHAKKLLPEAGHLILTFGSAFIYELKETGKLVNNCHKLPAHRFNRRMVTVGEIVSAYSELLEAIRSANPGLKIILTVSPVRHVRDGFVENQRSKATLLLSASELEKLYPETCSYFPSYEIMMDDLRDYRYYAPDLVHPNDQAIEYIWNHFMESCIEDEALQIIKRLDPLLKSLHHRPLHTKTKSFREFQQKTEEKISQMKKEFPWLKWEE